MPRNINQHHREITTSSNHLPLANGVIPFLKWAGGKRWLVHNHSQLFPTRFNTYIEPFLGSGAVFFKLRPAKAILSDSNDELMNAFQAIKDNWRQVVKYLRLHHTNHSKEYYYHVRSQVLQSRYKRAARLIYLNRTCWNGLFRVNRNGVFNVPIGTKTNVLLPTDKFDLAAQILKSAHLIVSDFEDIINQTQKNDFIFADPPYTAKHNDNGFLKYNEKLFSWNDQVRLRDSLVRAKNKGAKILVTNANHTSILELYKDQFELKTLRRVSKIAASSEFRRSCEELIIWGG